MGAPDLRHDQQTFARMTSPLMRDQTRRNKMPALITLTAVNVLISGTTLYLLYAGGGLILKKFNEIVDIVEGKTAEVKESTKETLQKIIDQL